MMNLLTDTLIHVRLADGEARTLTLPQVFAEMMRDGVAAFPALRPHQRHAWHAFLAQLGAIALHRAGQVELPTDAPAWCDLIRALTPEWPDDEPWRLVVEDLAKPAFLQPPVPEGALAGFRNEIMAADELDLLVTSKNHDLKGAVAAEALPDDWLFALVDLQTMEGFMGAGKYGIARMNGGFSSRPCVGLTPEGGIGAHLRRDIVGMQLARDRILREHNYYAPTGGVALVWTIPWDGTRALRLDQLDPFFVEIGRRVRLVSENGRLRAVDTATKCARIDAKALNGRTGDFWTPINVKQGKALTLGAAGFGYRQITRILVEFAPPPALSDFPHDSSSMQLVARGVARGQGKTEGYHERHIPFARQAAVLLGTQKGRDRLAAASQAQIADIGFVNKALRAAIGIVASGGKPLTEISADDRAAASDFTRRLDVEIDAFFFQALWERIAAMEAGADAIAAAQRAFRERNVGSARALLLEAVETVPCPAIRRPRARARAVRAFTGLIYRDFHDLRPASPETPDHEHARGGPVSPALA